MELWDIQTIDRAVGLVMSLVMLAGLAVAILLLRHWLRGEFDTKAAEAMLLSLGVAGGFFAVYVAYGTLRVQTMLAAETAINQDAGRLLDWERNSFPVRCVYGWYDRGAPAASDELDAVTADECLATIVVDREAFSEVLLYIEEVFFILQQAQDDQAKWGSGYAENVRYWRQDVSDDVTGLFSFHLAHRYPLAEAPMEGPLENMEHAGLRIDNYCARAERVRVCLEAVGRFADPSTSCPNENVTPSAELARVAQVCAAKKLERGTRPAPVRAVKGMRTPVP